MMKNRLDMGGQIYSCETRDAALESIHRMGTSQIGVNATYKHRSEQWVSVIATANFIHNLRRRDLASAISLLVRSSPPCDVLYRELWCIPTWLIGSSLIYHVSKWLEVRHGLNIHQQLLTRSFRFVQSFPDQTTELIAFWKQACRFDSEPVQIQHFEAENKWRDVVHRWNQTIVRLRLPDTLELPLPDFVDFDVY
jgi:hypothetical protein